ncbi:MAG TPA: ribbon-helix-helix domain-containing protein [Beutenbergiaceae bacterium]|nr:ribbon-helix-helix domain-containing protein [Beutenbergiaceae bacterium]
MNVSLPDALKEFFDAQVSEGCYGTSSEFVRNLIGSRGATRAGD